VALEQRDVGRIAPALDPDGGCSSLATLMKRGLAAS